MKNLIAIFVLIATMFVSCTRQAEQKTESQKMNGVEFAKAYGFQHPALDYGNGTARSNKPKANAVTFSVTADLTLIEVGGVLETTISPDAEWGGIQKFPDITTNDGATSICNWNWSGTVAPGFAICNSNGPGNYRSWTSDKITYNVHLSQFLPL